MDKTLYEMIFKRKSFHIFKNVGNESISGDELDDIQNAYTAFIPLNPGIKTAIRIVPEKQTNCSRGYGSFLPGIQSEKRGAQDDGSGWRRLLSRREKTTYFTEEDIGNE